MNEDWPLAVLFIGFQGLILVLGLRGFLVATRLRALLAQRLDEIEPGLSKRHCGPGLGPRSALHFAFSDEDYGDYLVQRYRGRIRGLVNSFLLAVVGGFCAFVVFSLVWSWARGQL